MNRSSYRSKDHVLLIQYYHTRRPKLRFFYQILYQIVLSVSKGSDCIWRKLAYTNKRSHQSTTPYSLFVRVQLSSLILCLVILSVLFHVDSLIVQPAWLDKHSEDPVLSGVLNEDSLVLLIVLHQVLTEKVQQYELNQHGVMSVSQSGGGGGGGGGG